MHHHPLVILLLALLVDHCRCRYTPLHMLIIGVTNPIPTIILVLSSAMALIQCHLDKWCHLCGMWNRTRWHVQAASPIYTRWPVETILLMLLLKWPEIL